MMRYTIYIGEGREMETKRIRDEANMWCASMGRMKGSKEKRHEKDNDMNISH